MIMVFAEKIVRLPPGDLGVAFGKQLQKACVLEVANSSQMKGKLQKGDIVIGFKDDGVEHRNLSYPLLVSKLNSTKHSHFRSITVVESDLMDERAIVHPPKSYRTASSSTSKEPSELQDEFLVALVRETAINEGITDYDEELILETIKQSLKARKASTKAFIDDSADISMQSSCEWAIVELATEAVSLAMAASGMPSGTGKRVAKILVKRAKKKLLKEMKSIARDCFGSPNPVKIAEGLFRIMGIIVGDIGFSEVSSIVYDAIGIWDAFQIVALLSLYFVSGGSALAAKLASMTPAMIDVVEAAMEVNRCC